MAGPKDIFDTTYLAEESLVNSQYCAVVQGSNDNGMVLPSGEGAGDVLGILQDYPDDNEAGRVRKLGISRARICDTVTRGDALEVGNAAGELQKLSASDHMMVAIAEVSGVKDDIIDVFMQLIPLDDINPSS